jgi:ATP-dependent Clp protease ATP-binding subunit ClpC
VLFDEIEKAHADVFNTLLQILEDGRLTDAQGHTIDFKNTVIIMTSNLGTQNLRKAGIGFAPTDTEVSYDQMKDKVTQELKRAFRPEFLNRIDEVIVFRELTMDNVISIVDLLMRRVTEQLHSQDISIELTASAKEMLAREGYDPTLGARPLRRAIQRLVEDPLSEKILWKEFTAGQKVVVNTEPDPDDPRRTKIVFIPEPSPVVPEPPVGVGAGSTESETS